MATFDFEGKKVYYERHGDKGRPLVVLNGLMMSMSSVANAFCVSGAVFPSRNSW